MKYESYENKEQLELDFLKEFDFGNESKEKVVDRFMEFFEGNDYPYRYRRGNVLVLKILEIENDKIIFSNAWDDRREYHVINKEEFSLKDIHKGDYILFKKDRYSSETKFEKFKILKCLNHLIINKIIDEAKKESVDLMRELDSEKFFDGYSVNPSLSEDDFYKIATKKIRELKNQRKQEEQDRIKDEEEEKKREEEIEQERKLFEEDGIFESNEHPNLKVEKNIIYKADEKIVLDKNTNNYFNFEDLNHRYFGISDLLSKEISHTLEREGKEVYRIEFGEGIKVNGVRINKQKLDFILQRIRRGEIKSEEEIKLVNKLSGVKFKCLNLSKIELHRSKGDVEIPISINLIDTDNFRVKFMGKERDFYWLNLKEHLVSGIELVRYFNSEDLFRFTRDFNLEKQEVFKELKKAVMLKNL